MLKKRSTLNQVKYSSPFQLQDPAEVIAPVGTYVPEIIEHTVSHYRCHPYLHR